MLFTAVFTKYQLNVCPTICESDTVNRQILAFPYYSVGKL